MNFYALDFETANSSLDSICSVGIVEFTNSEVTNTWHIFIDPEDWFSPMNVSVHGITSEMVKGEKTFKDVYPLIKQILENKIVVHHTAYDKSAFTQVCKKYDLSVPNIHWLDSARVVRRTWPQFKDKGYGLATVCDFLGIKFNHHDALEDAIAAGKILIEASKETTLTELDWLERIAKPITKRKYTSRKANIVQDGNPEGELYGETIVFTGTLFLERVDLSDLAADMGCNVRDNVTKETTLLVVGIQNTNSLKEGETKSGKHRKAEGYILKGQMIRILSEDDFLQLCKEYLSIEDLMSKKEH